MKPITALNAVSARTPILQSVLDALNEGRISEADQFDDQFTFTDRALNCIWFPLLLTGSERDRVACNSVIYRINFSSRHFDECR